MTEQQRPKSWIRTRPAGIGLYLLAVVLFAWQWTRYSARFDLIDATNGNGFAEPLDYVIWTAIFACVTVGYLIVKRAD